MQRAVSNAADKLPYFFRRAATYGTLSLILAWPTSSAFGFIGFKVGGECLVACGSDSLLNRGASSIGSAFMDGTVEKFRQAGSEFIANAKTQMDQVLKDRLKEFNDNLTDQRKLAMEGLSQQRQDLIEDLNDATENTLGDLDNVLSNQLNKLDEGLTAQITALDAVIKKGLDRLSVLLVGSGAFLLALLLAALFAGQKILLQRVSLTKRDGVILASAVVACTVFSTVVALSINASRDQKYKTRWEKNLAEAENANDLSTARIIVQLLRTRYPEEKRYAILFQKLDLVRRALVAESASARETATNQLASYQSTVKATYGQYDPDTRAIQAYLIAREADTGLGGITALALTSQTDKPLDELSLGRLSKDLAALSCNVTQYVREASLPSGQIIEDLAGKREAWMKYMRDGFSITVDETTVQKLGTPQPIASCGESSEGSFVHLAISNIDALRVQRKWNRMAGTILARCLFAKDCVQQDEWDALEKSIQNEQEVAYQSGQEVGMPLRLAAAIRISLWYNANRPGCYTRSFIFGYLRSCQTDEPILERDFESIFNKDDPVLKSIFERYGARISSSRKRATIYEGQLASYRIIAAEAAGLVDSLIRVPGAKLGNIDRFNNRMILAFPVGGFNFDPSSDLMKASVCMLKEEVSTDCRSFDHSVPLSYLIAGAGGKERSAVAITILNRDSEV